MNAQRRDARNRNRRPSTRWILAAAIGAVGAIGLLAGEARAQYRLNNANANDSNNRIGSGGYNDPNMGSRGQYAGVSGNDIVLRNVTAGKGFRGNVPYTDPRAFRGNLPGEGMSSFIANSSGAGFNGEGGFNSNAQQVRPFFSDSRGVPPPTGFERQGFTSGFVPAPPDYRGSGDLRLGNAFTTDGISVPRPGELLLPGPVNNQNNNSLITASPLYGVRQWDPGNPGDENFLNNFTSLNSTDLNRQPLDSQTIRRMQDEMLQPSLNSQPMGQRVGEGTLSNQNDQQNANQQQQPGGNQQEQNQQQNQNLSKPLTNPLESPDTGNSLTTNALNNQSLNSRPLSTNLDTGQGARTLVAGMVPQQQRTQQYSALTDRLKQYYGDNKVISDAEATQRFNQEVLALRQREQQARTQQQQRNEELTNGAAGQQPGVPGAVAGSGAGTGANGVTNPGGVTAPGSGNATDQTAPGAAIQRVPGPTGIAGRNRPRPEQVPSLKNLVKPKGLGEVLQTAEDLMRQGKFISALDQYDAAQQIAPNYAVPVLGRANAELGASYYTRAEIDLRQAFTQDPSLLEGQYDLRGMVGDDRLNYLVKDLKEIVNRDKTKPGPVFLLAYIMYNTGNERLASGYLDLADKRAGANDTFYRLVRAHWQLLDIENPSTPPPSELQPQQESAAPTTGPVLNK